MPYLDGKVVARQVLQHPAYAAVLRHNAVLSSGLTEQDFVQGAADETSPFGGFRHLAGNRDLIQRFLRHIADNREEWRSEMR